MLLILGGTAEARELAAELNARGVPVITSLAGRVVNPRLPAGEVRIGGFGGPAALAAWLREREVTAVVDATHPFAQRISASASEACATVGVRLLRLERRGWIDRSIESGWVWVDGVEGAARAVVDVGARRVFLTTGRQGLAAFASVETAWFLIRCVDPPVAPLPPHCQLLLDRGPYTLDRELALFDRHRIDLLVTKDSGGEHTAAKLDAAAARGVCVVVVRRPPRPGGAAVCTVAAAVEWALHAG